MLNFVEQARARSGSVFFRDFFQNRDSTRRFLGPLMREGPIPPGLYKGPNGILGLADVSDCFHRMRILTILGAWFCLPPVTAVEMDVVGMDLGIGVSRSYDLIFSVPGCTADGIHLECVLVPVCGGSFVQTSHAS